MKYKSLMVVFLLCAVAGFPYTAVLKTGKKIEGTLVEEDSKGIRIQDRSGVVLHLKKEQLDLPAMAELNVAPAEKPQEAAPIQEKMEKEPALPKEESNKKASAKEYRLEDLKSLPKISEFHEQPGSQTQPGNSAASSEDQHEMHLKYAWDRYIEKLHWLREKEAESEYECSQYVVAAYYDGANYVAAEPLPKPCIRIQEFADQIEETKEAARKEGIPLQWLENAGF